MSLERLPGNGVGIGLRRSMVKSLQQYDEKKIPAADFLELAPENWMNVGGRLGAQFEWLAERYPLVCHGLSLSIGSLEPLDRDFLASLKKFLDRFHIVHYSEHLSYCSGDGGHLYDLIPLPFTEEAVKHVASRVREVQDILERQISLENISYYATIDKTLSEAEFIRAVVEESRCGLLLDVNNIYVNSINHGYNAMEFLHQMPEEKITYIHVAGHYDEADDLKIDTHGADVKDPVWNLLGSAYDFCGLKPTLLERDFNIPPLHEVLAEAETIRRIQKQNSSRKGREAA